MKAYIITDTDSREYVISADALEAIAARENLSAAQWTFYNMFQNGGTIADIEAVNIVFPE